MFEGFLTILLLILIISFGGVFSFLVKISFKVYMRKYGRHMPARYICYYYNDKQIKDDESASKIAKIAYRAYTDEVFDDYQERLDEKRLPLSTLVNWARTIAEDLAEHPSPVLRVRNWFEYFNSDKYQWMSMVFPFCLDFYAHEMAYIWGAVYYWLKVEISDFNCNDVLSYIEEVACKRKFARFYFYHFKKSAGGDMTESIETYLQSSKTKGEITAEQTALLWLAIAKLTEGEVKNKKDLAPVIHQLTGFGKSSLEIKICGIFKDDDKEKVANIIVGQMPKLAQKVREIEK